MDFFTHQDSAKKNTTFLVVLYGVALLLLVCLANLIISAVLWVSSANSLNDLSTFFSWRTFGIVCLAVNAVVALAIIYKWLEISEGGKKVAETLGGKRIPPSTDKLKERQVLNVVEEMALASGMPVPPVYLLDHEQGINAFAAGNNPADAVIGVTQGSLESFNREQLQGVIAHEFSHILNGDMRLNLRLIALLNGILFLGNCGQFFLRGSSYSSSAIRRSGSSRLLLLGFALASIGWIGTFFGGLIKAAINRQREFLADASAVQFTRNPNGIASALKVIGGFKYGSRVATGGADEASHLFICNALSGFAFFKTHPPLADRIRRIEPGWDGKMIKPRPIPAGEGNSTESLTERKRQRIAGAVVLGSILANTGADGKTIKVQEEVSPQEFLESLNDPFTASSLLYALLLADEDKVRAKQLGIIKENGAPGSADMSLKIYREINRIEPAYRVVFIEKAMPALKCMSHQQYLALRNCIKLLIKADRVVELFEWCLFQLVRHYLGAEFGDKRQNTPRYTNVNDVEDQYALVASTLIHHCHLQSETRERAFVRGTNTVGLYNTTLLPQGDCTMEGFIRAVNMLADCHPLLKARILKGLVNVIDFDGIITPMEKELITCIAAIMDCPIPRLKWSLDRIN